MVPSENQNKIDKRLTNIKDNKFVMMIFICLINEKNMDDNIIKFIKEFGIENNEYNYNKILSYYKYFIEIKSILK